MNNDNAVARAALALTAVSALNDTVQLGKVADMESVSALARLLLTALLVYAYFQHRKSTQAANARADAADQRAADAERRVTNAVALSGAAASVRDLHAYLTDDGTTAVISVRIWQQLPGVQVTLDGVRIEEVQIAGRFCGGYAADPAMGYLSSGGTARFTFRVPLPSGYAAPLDGVPISFRAIEGDSSADGARGRFILQPTVAGDEVPGAPINRTIVVARRRGESP